MLHRMYLFITKFFYYGYAGTKCVDFGASCIHNLIYAHMNRVNKFMKSDKTHLVWNDDPNTKGMRKLAEFTELSRRMAENEMQDNHYFGIVCDKYRSDTECFLDRINDPEYRKESRIAMKKDRMKVDQLTKRYYTLLQEEVSGFWD